MQRVIKGPIDVKFFYVVFILLGIGVVMVYSASMGTSMIRYNNSEHIIIRHLIRVVLGAFLLFIFINIDYHLYQNWAIPIFLAGICLLFLIFIPGMGIMRNGATRWLNFRIITFQPSEIMKLFLIIYMADALSRKQNCIKNFNKSIFPFVVLVGLVFGLIVIQPDLSSASMVVMIALIMLFLSGVDLKQFLLLLVAGSSVVFALMFTQAYRVKRFFAFLDPWKDPYGTGFHIIQSMIAVGSGGLWGQGLAASKQKYLYLPEQFTDFSFAIAAEELGFIRIFFLICIYVYFLIRAISISLNAPDDFGMLLGSGLSFMVTVHVVINIGVVLGLLPATGIPLPFISFGGTSILILCISCGILLNISRFRRINI